MNRLITGLAFVLLVNQFSAASDDSVIEVGAVGDIYISQRLIDEHARELEGITLNGDIVFGNFEGVLSDVHSPADTLRLRLTMPVAAAGIVRKIGINTISLANNHTMDLGKESYVRTFRKMQDLNFNVAGYNDRGTVINIHGKRIRFVAFSFEGPNNVNDPVYASKLISSFSEDIIIISAHMGGENSRGYVVPGGMEYHGTEMRGDVIRFSRACIDAGADLVLGHGPHILRGMELYKDKLIVYSLGNFIFDYPGAGRFPDAPAFSISVQLGPGGDFRRAIVKSYKLHLGVPVPDPEMRAYKSIEYLSSTNLGNETLVFTADEIINRRR